MLCGLRRALSTARRSGMRRPGAVQPWSFADATTAINCSGAPQIHSARRVLSISCSKVEPAHTSFRHKAVARWCASAAWRPDTLHLPGLVGLVRQHASHTSRWAVAAAGSRRRRGTAAITRQQSQPANGTASGLGTATPLSSGDFSPSFSTDTELDDTVLWGDMEEPHLTDQQLADERVIRDGWTATKAEQKYWTAQGQRLKRAAAVAAVDLLDPQWRCGVPYERLGGTLVEHARRVPAETGVAPSGSMWFRRAKTRNPFAVVLIRVGAFYESVGYDAAILMEYAGLNPMGGGRSDVARAGFPERQIHDVLKLLVEHTGLTVAVWEEGPDTKTHGQSRKEQKPRHFAQLVTPENPVYLYDFAESKVGNTTEVPDIKGVSVSSRGCSLFVLNRNSNVVAVYNNISPESVRSLVVAGRSEQPIVHLCWPQMHQALPRKIKRTSSQLEKDYLTLLKHLTANNVTVKTYQSDNPLAEFIERIRKALQWPADRDFQILPAWDVSTDWPGVRPLYYTTLAQLGLVYNPGVPSLVDYLLPLRSGKLVRGVIRGILRDSPPYDVAAATRRVVRSLGSDELLNLLDGLPQFDVSGRATPAKVELVLNAQQGNADFFRTLRDALEPAIEVLSSSNPVLSSLAVDTWPLLCHTMGCPRDSLDRHRVLQAAQDAVTAIAEVVADVSSNSTSDLSSSIDDIDDSERSASAKGQETAKQALDRYISSIEHYRDRIQPNVIQEEARKVDEAYYGVVLVLDGLLHTLTVGAQQAGLSLSQKDLPCAHVDANNLSVWLKLPSAQLRQFWKGRAFKVLVSPDAVNDTEVTARSYQESSTPEQLLHHPHDRNGSVLKSDKVFSCPLLDQKLGSYRGALALANEAATEKLQQLAEQLHHTKLQIGAAVQLGILLGALYEHRVAADAAGWSVPEVGLHEQMEAGIELSETDSTEQRYGVLKLKGLKPYWLSPEDMPVANDVHLQGFDLLTGPNMAGKSTWLRSLTAAAVAGSAGLAIPAEPGSALPEFDAIILRTFTGDAPDEQLSAFAVEMEQLKHVLDAVRPGSLVLVDELGKGTDVVSGTALAAAILDELVESGARGVFATHLHGLVHLMAGRPRISYHCMAVKEQAAPAGHMRLVPTRQLEPGVSYQSLALDVAREMGLPADVLDLAQDEYQKLEQLGGYRALIKLAGGQYASIGGAGSGVSEGTIRSVSVKADAVAVGTIVQSFDAATRSSSDGGSSNNSSSSIDSSSNSSSSNGVTSNGRRRRRVPLRQRGKVVSA